MREPFRINSFLWFAAVVSLFGLATVTVLLMKPTGYYGNFAFTPTIIGLLYTATCVFGVFAVFFPQKCQRTLIFGKYVQSPSDQTFAPGKLQFTGHHPDCSRFSANRIKIRNKVLCSACGGLLVGAMIAIAGAVSYFFFRFDFLWSDLRILVVSDAGLLLGLFQFRFAGWIKLSVNALFVVCSLVTLVEADLLSKSLFIDLYVLGLIVFMLSARILLSEWNNKRTCNKCLQCV